MNIERIRSASDLNVAIAKIRVCVCGLCVCVLTPSPSFHCVSFTLIIRAILVKLLHQIGRKAA